MTDEKPLQGRIALVTGASRGIGQAAALALAEAGAHVIALARTIGGLEALDDQINRVGGEATLIPFDLLELDRIDDLGAEIYGKWQKLDILVGNAGILGPQSPIGHIKAEEWEKVIDLNLNANWRLLRIFDPMLQRSDAGRAVFVTSAAAHLKQPFRGPYAASKAALEAMVITYARELQTTNVRANLLDPGEVSTTLRTRAFPGIDPKTLTQPADLGPLFVQMCAPEFQKTGEVIRYKS